MRRVLRPLLPSLIALIATIAPVHAQDTPPAPADSAGSGLGPTIEMPGGIQVRQIPSQTDTSRAMPRIFLSWGAPFGEAGARDQTSFICGDTSTVDTLYLSMDPVSTRPQFVGWLATLYFKAAPGDTLSSHWQYSTGGEGRAPLRNEVADARTPMPGPAAWPEVQAFGGGHMDHTPSSARLRMVAAVDVTRAPVLLGGRRYTLARIIVPRPPAQEGCARPLCVELATIQCTFSAHQGGQEPISNVGHRLVRYQDPLGVACDGPPQADKLEKRSGKR